jgi:hypothetical protein
MYLDPEDSALTALLKRNPRPHIRTSIFRILTSEGRHKEQNPFIRAQKV